MVKWSVKKVLARRVCKIFSGMRTFLVERFTALTFWLLFSQVKSDIKEKEYLSHTMAPPFNLKCFLDEQKMKIKNKFEIKNKKPLSQKQSWRDVQEKEWLLKLMLN